MKHYRLPVLAVCSMLLLLSSEAFCGVSDAAVLFLRIAPGARSAGMGEAFVAVSDDASATHWNPAGLGEYPLAESWYQYKLADDTHLKEVARKALEGKLPEDYRETIQSWRIEGNLVSRLVDGEWKRIEMISIDPSLSFVSSLSRVARTDNKELFKLATRVICYTNSGVTFDDINTVRLDLLRLVAQEEAAVTKVNEMMEQILVVWQDLRLQSNVYGQFKKSVETAESDSTVNLEELTELQNLATSCDIGTRPGLVAVPYSVLLSAWRSWDVPWEESIQKIAVLENSVPNDNYTHYDIWVITNFGLKHFDGVAWRDGMSSENIEGLTPRKDDKITDIIGRVLGTADQELIVSRQQIVAKANNVISRDALRQLTSSIEAALPADYINRDELMQRLQGMDKAWIDCLLDNNRLEELQATFKTAYADTSLTDLDLDRIFFASEKAVRTSLPSVLQFPFNAVFDGELTDLAVDQNRKILYVATSKGIYRFNGRAWESFSTGISGERVECIEIVKRDQVWIGTASGVKHFAQGKWKSYGSSAGITSLPIKHISVKNERMVWAASDSDLYYFDGNGWTSSYKYTTSVTDSARSVFANFYGDIDQARIDLEAARLEVSQPEFFANPSAGIEIDIPFAPVFESNITCLGTDNDNNLWIGTELGVKRFDGNSWRSYGYKAIKVEREMTIEELASEYLKTSDPNKIDGFVAILKRKNTISEGPLPAGRVVYVYANPAGSPINTLFNHGSRMFVGSLYGTFSYSNGSWERYYHENLHHANTKDITGAAGELWFATSDRVAVYAHARKEFSFTHSKWLPELASDLYYEFFTYVQPVGGLGTIGANITFLSFGDIARTSENNPEILDEFSSFDGALTLSYGIRASRSMAIGLSAKIIYSKLADQGAGAEIGKGSGTSFAVDGGLIYHMSQRLTFGAALTNLGPDMSYIDAAQSDPLPRNVAVGIAYKLLDTPYNRLTVTTEANKLIATLTDDFQTELKEVILNFGAEYWYGTLLALRAGYYIDKEGESTYPTVGLGLQLENKYRIDFAYIPTSEQYVLGNTLRTSLTVRL